MNYHQRDQRIRQRRGMTSSRMPWRPIQAPATSIVDVQMPYVLALSAYFLEDRFDAVVADEAQDFGDECWLGVEMLLRDQVNGHLYIFSDENQALYPRKAKLPVEDEPFYLTNNCRTEGAPVGTG